MGEIPRGSGEIPETPESRREAFLKDATEKVSRVIPESIDADGFSPNHMTDSETRYFYFSPLTYFRNELVDEQMINDLKTDKRMLSVGAGRADLERVLEEGYGIPANHITIADIRLHSKARQTSFPMHEFDMKKEWPKFDAKFDYIIFPESFGMAFAGPESTNGSRTHRFFDIVENVVKKTKSGEQIARDDEDFFVKLLEMDVPEVKDELRTLEYALNDINDSGEIRLSGALLSEQEDTYLRIKLRERHPNVRMFYNRAGGGDGVLVLKKMALEKE